MVDRDNREIAAKLLRQLIDGVITNDEFMRAFPRSQDIGIQAILNFTWAQFSDLRIHKLVGRDCPTSERRAALERCFLFLRSSLEFDWQCLGQALRRGCWKRSD